MLIISVDPGLTGALAALTDRRVCAVADMPTEQVGGGTVKRRVDCAALAELVRMWRWSHGGGGLHAVVERVGAMPDQGVASVFSFGETAGAIRGVLAACKVPVTYVTPPQWKKRFRIGKDKAEARARASELFPEAAHHWTRVKDHGRAEAVLIARYGWELCS